MKFLIIKTSSLGDIVHAFTPLAYLRKKFPDAEIDWVVESHFKELVVAHPQVNKVFLIETKSWRKGKNLKSFFNFRREIQKQYYDVVFELQGNIKSALLLAQVKAKKKVGFGWKSLPEWPNGLFTNVKINPLKGRNIREDYLYILQEYFKDHGSFQPEEVVLNISAQEKEDIENLLRPLKGKRKVLIAPGAAWENKQLSQIQLEQVIENEKDSFFFFSWGGEKEKVVSAKLHQLFPEKSCLLPRFSLSGLQNFMSQVDLVVAMDSLPLHLCGTTQTPSLSFFGPTNPKKYLPLGKCHRYIQGICPYGITFEKRCDRLRTCKTGACIKEINLNKDI